MIEESENVCEEAVFDELFHRIAPRLHSFLYYRSGDESVAADLVQEAFMKLWENCSKVLPASAKAYVFRVGQNALFKRHAKGKVRASYAALGIEKSTTNEDPQYQLEEMEFAERLKKTLAELPSASREVFLLSRIDGLKYREIADRLGVSQKAVEKRMHKALLQLRDLHPDI